MAINMKREARDSNGKKGKDSVLASFRSTLYRLARLTGDIQAVGSGKPSRMARRAKNTTLGRLLGRGGFWRSLWG